jgi:hypothetical protein
MGPPINPVRFTALRQRTRVDDVEAELVEESRDSRLRAWIVASDDEGTAILRAGREAIGGELGGVDVVERLYHP